MSTAGQYDRKGLTKLPAKPPAMSATPINKTTLARTAAGPSEPHPSPEKAELRWDLSSKAVIKNPTFVRFLLSTDRRVKGKDKGGHIRVEHIAGIQSTKEM